MKAPRTEELSKQLAAAKVRDRLAFSHMFDHACELEQELQTQKGACELFAAGQESYLKEISELSRRNYGKSCILDKIADILDLPNEATDDEIYSEAIRVINRANALDNLLSDVNAVIGHWRKTDWFKSDQTARNEIVVGVDQQAARQLLKKLETV